MAKNGTAALKKLIYKKGNKNMTVKELIKKLKEMNPNAEVMAITHDGEYQSVIDCEEEYTNLVTIGLERE